MAAIGAQGRAITFGMLTHVAGFTRGRSCLVLVFAITTKRTNGCAAHIGKLACVARFTVGQAFFIRIVSLEALLAAVRALRVLEEAFRAVVAVC
jgi:hypothetical protein